MIFRAIRRAALAMALSCGGQGLWAASFYVATGGSDSNPGTAAAPFRSIQRGINAAAPGDTIIVKDGSYGPSGGQDSMGVTINKAGSSAAWITLKAENKGRAVLDCQLVCHSYINFGSSSAYWIIQGFTIQRGRWAGIFSNSRGGRNIVIRENTIRNIGNRPDESSVGIMGVYTDAAALNWRIEANVFRDIGRTTDLTGNHDHGIYMKGNALIINNVFFNALNGWHIQTAAGFSGTIANNTFYGPAIMNKTGQLKLWGAASNLTIANNIFYNPRSVAIAALNVTLSGSCAIRNNIVFNSGGGVSLGESLPGACVQSGNRLNVNPLLANPGSYDFHLLAGSPAIDGGIAIAGVSADFDGGMRPRGAGYDIGAFESGSTAPAGDTTAPVISAVAASATQDSATVSWTTSEPADGLVEYGPTASYGSATSLAAALTTAHQVALSGLAAGAQYHYRVKSKDAAGNLAASTDATLTTGAGAPGAGCASSAGSWKNISLPSQAGSFSVEFDATPSAATMDGVIGVSNGAASSYSALAAAVRFNNAGRIDARNDGGYSVASAIAYSPNVSYRFRLAIDLAAHTYSAYVRAGGSAEQLIGANFAFRTEQASVKTLNNLGVMAANGGVTVCNAKTASSAPSDVAAPLISGLTAVPAESGATIAWTTSEPADGLVEYGPTSAYGSATSLAAALTTAHQAVLGGLAPGTVYHYRVKSKDGAGNLAASSDASFTTLAPAPACVTSAGSWRSVALPARTGSFTVEFDATPSAAKMDGVIGVSKGAPSSYSALAAAVRFNNAGRIDARNGGSYAAASSLSYSPNLSYRFRLVIDLAAHTYSAYVRQGGSAEQRVGSNYAFRSEQASAQTLDSLGAMASAGGVTVCNPVVK